jgi:hypothetical protein
MINIFMIERIIIIIVEAESLTDICKGWLNVLFFYNHGSFYTIC